MGPGRHGGRPADRAPARPARPQLPDVVAVLRPAAPAAHQRGHLRLRRQRDLRGRLLLHAAAPQGAHVERRAEPAALLGVAGHHRRRGHHAAARLQPVEGVRGARVAHRHRHRGHLGRLRRQLLRHARPAARAAPLRRALVLHRDDRDHRGAPHLQQPRGRGGADQELLDLRGRAGRLHAVVVRPQRGRLLPDHAVPRHDVLLPAQGGGAAGVLLPAVDPALLDPRLHLHLGGAAPPPLHRAARVGLDARHALLGDALDAVLGRHDQRAPHAAWRVGEGDRRSRAQVLRGRHHLLRHVDVRGAAPVDQERQRALALHGLDHRPRPRGRARLGRLHGLRDDLLAPAAPLPDGALRARSWRSCTSGSARSASCSTSWPSTRPG